MRKLVYNRGEKKHSENLIDEGETFLYWTQQRNSK